MSRQNVNALQDAPESDAATIHSEATLTHVIESTDKPVNCFQNQIFLEEATTSNHRIFILFGSKTRHLITFSSREGLLDLVKNVVTPNVVNAIHCELPILAHIQDKLVKLFPATKFWYCKTRVADIVRRDEQKEIMIIEHNRAHRADQENVKQVLLDYYFPKMGKIATEVVVNCRVCEKAKYDRHPKKQELGVTPIPSRVGEMLHIDIFSTAGKYLTIVDKFSKFSLVQPFPRAPLKMLKLQFCS